MSDIVERARSYEIGNLAPQSTWVGDMHELAAEIERLQIAWDAIVGERDRLRTEIELLHAELRVTKKLGLAALQDAMRQARISKSR